MVGYRRNYAPGGRFFFTVTLDDRRSSALVDHVTLLRAAFRKTRGERPFVVDGALAVATVMSATGSFDHRAIDGADGAQLMQAFQDICEKPLALVA